MATATAKYGVDLDDGDCPKCGAIFPFGGLSEHDCSASRARQHLHAVDALSNHGDPAPVTATAPAPFKSRPLDDERADLDWLLHTKEHPQVTVPKFDWIADPRARASTEQVYAHMAMCSQLLRDAGDDGTVIYAVDWAARHTGISSPTVSRALRRLRQAELIEIVRTLEPESNDRMGTRVYRVNPSST